MSLRRSPELTYNLVVDLAARRCIAAANERSLAFKASGLGRVGAPESAAQPAPRPSMAR